MAVAADRRAANATRMAEREQAVEKETFAAEELLDEIEEDVDVYESLPPNIGTMTHMFAGAVAGIAEHCVMYPFDVVKVGCFDQEPDFRIRLANPYLQGQV